MAAEMLIMGSHEEWLQKRKSYIGGSDASAIVGMNPYVTNVELWEEKTGLRQARDISNEALVKFGQDAEPLMREMFKLDFPQYKVSYVENNIWVNPDYPFAHASLDGWIEDENGRKGVFENKTTSILQSMQKEKWKDRIPDNYYIQVLHYMMVTGWDFAILKARLKYEYSGEISASIKHYKIERADVLEDIEYLAKKEEEFYQCIKEGKRPSLVLPTI